MGNKAQEALDLIRQKLQVILLRADLCRNTGQCEVCTSAVCEIVKDIREIEEFIREPSKKNA